MTTYRQAHEGTSERLNELFGMATALYHLGVEYSGLANNDEEATAITSLIVRVQNIARDLSAKHVEEWNAAIAAGLGTPQKVPSAAPAQVLSVAVDARDELSAARYLLELVQLTCTENPDENAKAISAGCAEAVRHLKEVNRLLIPDQIPG
ncbi:hypothetical protein LVO79_21060 (plasmid) [Roseivivax marinus]|uniref:hypothetical protein n=1 Tax=Roseivivax marinus TaxID=1379903 RepID=UPI001F0358CE|nr:hypothetical protein [Roseivivax marinus]UMA67290.1 hypothetical protein LVO79_21060 [Roseivivax marinus]